MKESEGIEKITFPLYSYCCKESRPCPIVSQYQLDATVTEATGYLRLIQPPQISIKAMWLSWYSNLLIQWWRHQNSIPLCLLTLRLRTQLSDALPTSLWSLAHNKIQNVCYNHEAQPSIDTKRRDEAETITGHDTMAITDLQRPAIEGTAEKNIWTQLFKASLA